MDVRDGLWQSLGWVVGLVVTVGLAALAVVLVRRHLGPGEEAAQATAAPPDWIALLTGLQGGGMAGTPWIGWAPQLAARAGECPPALRAPLAAALGRAMEASRDPMVAASMSRLRTVLAALPAP